MANELKIPRGYRDGAGLTKEKLDASLRAIEDFFNSVKLTDDNFISSTFSIPDNFSSLFSPTQFELSGGDVQLKAAGLTADSIANEAFTTLPALPQESVTQYNLKPRTVQLGGSKGKDVIKTIPLAFAVDSATQMTTDSFFLENTPGTSTLFFVQYNSQDRNVPAGLEATTTVTNWTSSVFSAPTEVTTLTMSLIGRKKSEPYAAFSESIFAAPPGPESFTARTAVVSPQFLCNHNGGIITAIWPLPMSIFRVQFATDEEYELRLRVIASNLEFLSQSGLITLYGYEVGD